MLFRRKVHFWILSLHNVIVAAILIIARFAWSAYKMQTGNIVLCAIAAVLLIVVLAVVVAKANKPKEIITKFLQDLNVK